MSCITAKYIPDRAFFTPVAARVPIIHVPSMDPNHSQINVAAENVVIYHNPDCGTSRNVLEALITAGYAPTVIEYLQEGWTRPQLLGLFAATGLTPHTALRVSKSPAESMGLLEEGVTEERLLQAMVEHPILVNRPIVCTRWGVRLCRPSESVHQLLDRRPTD